MRPHAVILGALLAVATIDAQPFSWQTVEMRPSLLPSDLLVLADGQHGWAACGGWMLRTTDGGASWVRQSSGTSSILKEIDFVDNRHSWVVLVD